MREDKRVKALEMFERTTGKNKYAKLALNAWDHTMSKPQVRAISRAVHRRHLRSH